jgi:non-ribosomal peptide synthetase component F
MESTGTRQRSSQTSVFTRQLANSNQAATGRFATKCLHELFEERALATPEATALVCGDNRLTYRELNERSNQLAHYLRRSGVGPDVLVGICMHRRVEMIVGLLGTLKAGGAYVPLDASYPKQRLAGMLDDVEMKVVLTTADLLGTCPSAARA